MIMNIVGTKTANNHIATMVSPPASFGEKHMWMIPNAFIQKNNGDIIVKRGFKGCHNTDDR